MSGGGDELPVGPDWVRIRQDYEQGARPVSAIAGEAGLEAYKLSALAKRQGWRLRKGARPKAVATRETIARLKSLLQQRLVELEGQLGTLGAEATAASSERDIRSMNTLVRTLEKVLELERKDRASRNRRRKEYRAFNDAEREALANRLDAMHRERGSGNVDPGGSGVQS